MSESNTLSRAMSALKGFAKKEAKRERCEMCATALLVEHEHVLELATRRMICACPQCAMLFETPEQGSKGKLARIPHRRVELRGFRMSDAQWDALGVPIHLAFFVRTETAAQAFYPSPAGITESLLTIASWDELEAQNLPIASMKPHVEALLINRIGEARKHFIVPVDECFKLTGIVRMHWSGLSGGSRVWAEIQGFFEELERTATPVEISADVEAPCPT